jgi:pimeloyl-ACP methyl ester carboxylesterase
MAAAWPGIAFGAQTVDETRYVPLGGIEQWISVKGDDAANPVLLVVHGGPGETQWPNADKYIPWQRAFTVVQWDQRGAGRTFSRSGREQTPDVNLKRIVADGIELSEYLCRRLNKKKIIVLGHSWGSDVAVNMVQARPDLFAAYVGTGQVTSWAGTVQTQFDLLMAKARADKNDAAIAKLEAIGTPDPANTKQYFGMLNDLNFRAAWAPSDRDWITHLRTQAQAMKDDPDFKDVDPAEAFSGKSLIADEMATDLPTTAARIDTAFFLIQGRDDVVAPTKAAVDYFNKLEAPAKQLVLIPNAGHFAFMTAGEDFLAALTDKVRPVALLRGA